MPQRPPPTPRLVAGEWRHTMTFTKDDVKEALLKVVSQAQQHTELVLTTQPVSSEKSSLRSLGSGILLERGLMVTCNHVTRKGSVHYFGAGRLDRDRAPDDPWKHAVRPATLEAVHRAGDLALLRADPSWPAVSPRIAYDIHRSNIVTEQWLLQRRGSAAFIMGYWGKRTSCIPYNDGQLYVEAFLYASCGPLINVGLTELIADMAEAEILIKSDRFPKGRGPRTTRGRRNLGGISGSGLWMLLDDGPILVGIVLGARRGRRDEHLIRVTPVWCLQTWMAELPTSHEEKNL